METIDETSSNTTEHSSPSLTSSNTTKHSSPSSTSTNEEVNEIVIIESPKHERVLNANSSSSQSSISRKSNHSLQQKRPNHRTQYLSSWEDNPAAFYISYYYDNLGVLHSKYIRWLYKKINEENSSISLGCLLCEKYGMWTNKNGSSKAWATKGFDILALDKIKDHRWNKKHQEAEK